MSVPNQLSSPPVRSLVDRFVMLGSPLKVSEPLPPKGGGSVNVFGQTQMSSVDDKVPIAVAKDLRSNDKILYWKTRVPLVPEEKRAIGKKGKKAFKLRIGMSLGASEFRITLQCHSFSLPTVNSAANKYLQFVSGSSANLTWASLLNGLPELSYLEGLFNEVFVHSVKLDFIPNNSNSSNNTASTTTAGAPGNLNTMAAVIAFLPHSQSGAFADSSSGVLASLADQVQHKFVDMGKKWSFTGKNPEAFDWGAPLTGTSTTSNYPMGWVVLSVGTSTLGGVFNLGTAYASGAAAGIGDLLESGNFGTMLQTVTLSLRSRF